MSKSTKLDRADWLDAALDTLHEVGIEGVRVEKLARALDVTKGSFYHHFKNRDELLTAMVDRWRGMQEGILEWLKASTPDSRQRIEELIAFIHTKDSRHDIGIRSWGRLDSHARKAIQAVDHARLRYVEGLFRDLGFDDDGARLRARLIYYYQVGEHTLSLRDPEELRARLERLRHELLMRPS
jgi:AcrR family transcriptional regulator